MKTKLILLAALSISALVAQTPAPDAGKLFAGQLRGPESEVTSLVEAMPEELINFAPKGQKAFEGVRTFAQQAKHIAYVNYMVASAMLGEKNPSTSDDKENGPVEVKTKAQIVEYLKASFAYSKKAMASLTNENLMGLVTDAFDAKRQSPRASLASIILWHSFDHYGQMVVYARMNNIVPPASR